MSAYQHFVINGSGSIREIFPLDFVGSNFRYQRKKKEGQIFYRVTISNKLVFINNLKEGITDYTYFNDIESDPNRRCEKLTYEVKKYCDGEYRVFWRGTIVAAKGFFDKDQCRFEVRPEVLDNYNCIFNEWDREINILDDTSVISTELFILPDYEYIVCRRDEEVSESDMISWSMWYCIPNSATWQRLYYNQIRYACDGYETVMIWAREFTYTACIGGVCQPPIGSGWVLNVDDCGVSGLCRYVRKPQGFDAARASSQGYINFGSCTGTFGTVDVLPPPKQFLDVTLAIPPVMPEQHPNSFPRIWGYKSGCSGRYEFKIINHMGVMPGGFTWTVGGSLGGTIFSGQGTDTLIIDTNTPGSLPPTGNTVTIDCDLAMNPSLTIHTVDTFTLFITKGSLHFGESNLEKGEILGPDEICIGAENVRFEYPVMHNCGGAAGPDFFISKLDENLIGQDILTEGTDYVITSGGGALDGFIVVNISSFIKPSPTDLANLTTVPLRIYIGCDSTDGLGGSDCSYINEAKKDYCYIKYLPNTDMIRGSEGCEPSAEDCHYKVFARNGATYEWEVTGGTIDSGQGTNEIIVTWGSDAAAYCVGVKESVAGCCNTLIQMSECGDDGRPPFYWCIISASQTLGRNRWLIGAVEYMLKNVECNENAVIQSDYFEWNGVGDAPGYTPGNNYVTGMLNQMNKLTIAQKSDILTPNATNPATRGIWTIKKALEVLRVMFNVYWVMDGNANMRLEHISFFDFALGLDTTLPQFRKETKSLNKYEYRNPEYPKYERFTYMEAGNADFIGADIEYDSFCVIEDEDNMVESYIAELITTDVKFISTEPEQISKQGFVIIANEDDGSGNLSVITATGRISNQLIANAPLSWANLHYAFHRHDRYLRNGKMNLQQETFITFKPNIKQVPLEIKICCEIMNFDPKKKVRTELGWQILGLKDAEVETADYSIKKETLKLTLLYPH